MARQEQIIHCPKNVQNETSLGQIHGKILPHQEQIDNQPSEMLTQQGTVQNQQSDDEDNSSWEPLGGIQCGVAFKSLLYKFNKYANKNGFSVSRKANSFHGKRSLELYGVEGVTQRGHFYCKDSACLWRVYFTVKDTQYTIKHEKLVLEHNHVLKTDFVLHGTTFVTNEQELSSEEKKQL